MLHYFNLLKIKYCLLYIIYWMTIIFIVPNTMGIYNLSCITQSKSADKLILNQTFGAPFTKSY